MKKITPQTFWNIGSTIIFLPLVKLWFDEFLKHPYGIASITGSIFILISIIWSIWYKDNEEEKGVNED